MNASAADSKNSNRRFLRRFRASAANAMPRTERSFFKQSASGIRMRMPGADCLPQMNAMILFFSAAVYGRSADKIAR